MEMFNVYCDESCHLENDNKKYMVLGAVWCPLDKTQEISTRIREIKEKHFDSRYRETKWNKVSPAKLEFYIDLIDYFFDETNLHFRAIIADKTNLDHGRFQQSHDDWYYKMYFSLLKIIFNPRSQPEFNGVALSVKRHPKVNGKEATFWHLISAGEVEDDRTPDLRRCERVGWPKPIIENSHHQIMKVWKNERRGETRILLWLEEAEYLVVLAERKDYILFWTAYPVTQNHSKRKLQKEYEQYQSR